MGKLDFSEMVNLALNTEGAIVNLSPLSRSILLSLMTNGWEVFRWGNLTPEQRDEAENAVAIAALELMTEVQQVSIKSANIYNIQAQGVNGGTSTANAWTLRGITTVNNYGAIVSWDSVGFRLPAGLWLIDMSLEMVFSVSGLNAVVGLWSSAGALIARGNNHRGLANLGQDVTCRKVVALAIETELRPMYWTANGVANIGLGAPRNIAGETETYMTITIQGVESD